MEDLFTNRNSKRDFVHNGITESIRDYMDVFIASAFFTEFDVIKLLLGKNCHIRIIVRLGFPTSPFALEKLLNNKNIEARFYTNPSFHPKMYIFGDHSVLVGSANLTKSAITINQEVMIRLLSDDYRFDELRTLFSEYWDEAEVLTEYSIESYREMYNKFKTASDKVNAFDDEVIKVFGDKNFSNINRGKNKVSNQKIFLNEYRKSYQVSCNAYKYIAEEYSKKSRKISEDKIPLRLEIDSFFSFVRDRHAVQESWNQTTLGWDESKIILVRSLIDEWLTIRWDHFEERIVNENYPLITRVFDSPDSIDSSSPEDIVDGLCVLHSFHDRLRFYKGGLDTLRKNFLDANDIQDVKNTITYLIYGEGEIVVRMSDCIFNEKYKLNIFGRSNVQELIGWINKENLPVINGRTTKVLRYFGFDVLQL